MNKLTGLVGAMLAGASAMFLLDPDRGARRRALVRNRASGTFAGARERWRGDTVSDDVLAARVRARLGLVCDVATLDIGAHDGCVTIRGVASRAEIPTIVRTAKWTRGVGMIDDQLEAHDLQPAETEPTAH